MIRFARDGRSLEGGQILALFAGAAIGLLVISALSLDAGSAFLGRRDAQNAADLAAMAGTKRLADYRVKGATLTSTNNIDTAISASLAANNCANCAWTARYVGPRSGASFQDLGVVTTGTPPGEALGVKVDVRRTAPTFLLRVIGWTSWDIATTATAIAAKPTGAPGGQLLPIGMQDGLDLAEGQIYPLTNGKDAPGQFGWLAWFGTNDPNALSNSLCEPDNPPFSLPTWFPGDPGKSNAKDVRACLQKWVDNKETVLIPIVDRVGELKKDVCSLDEKPKGENTCYEILAIAAFQLISYSQPAVDQINGQFMGTYPYTGTASVPGGLTQPPGPSDDFYFIGLAQ